MVGQNNGLAFKDTFEQAYGRYHIRKKAIYAAHVYGASANHAHAKDYQMITVDALQALANATMEDKEEMSNLTSINLTLSQSLTQPQEPILVLSEHLQTL